MLRRTPSPVEKHAKTNNLHSEREPIEPRESANRAIPPWLGSMADRHRRTSPRIHVGLHGGIGVLSGSRHSDQHHGSLRVPSCAEAGRPGDRRHLACRDTALSLGTTGCTICKADGAPCTVCARLDGGGCACQSGRERGQRVASCRDIGHPLQTLRGGGT